MIWALKDNYKQLDAHCKRSTNVLYTLTGFYRNSTNSWWWHSSEKYKMPPKSQSQEAHCIFCWWLEMWLWLTSRCALPVSNIMVLTTTPVFRAPISTLPIMCHCPVLFSQINVLSLWQDSAYKWQPLREPSLTAYSPLWLPCLLNSYSSQGPTHLAFLLNHTSRKKSSQVDIFCLTFQDK